MTKHGFFISILSLLVFSGLISCNDTAPQIKQPAVVKHQIAAQSTSTVQAAGTALPGINSAKERIEGRNTATAQPAEDLQSIEPTSNPIDENRQIVSTYDPNGRFDPFEPLFKDEPTAEVRVAGKDVRKRRVPQTPLERVALSQLKLSAIIQAPSGNRGLVVDATGKGYIVENGTYIGLNSGRITKIDKNRIVIEEDIEDIMGELKIQHSELKLQKPAGEL